VGVSRLDGNTWTDYGTSNGLPDLYVQTINQDKQGNIWVGTENGAAKFDGIKGRRMIQQMDWRVILYILFIRIKKEISG